MTSPDPPRAADRGSRLYRLLVRLMPFEFRSDFGEEMTDVFRQERRDAALEGRGGLASLWLRTVAGMVRNGRPSAPGRTLAGHPVRSARPATNSCTDPRRGRLAGAWHRGQHRDLQFSERPVPQRAPCCVGPVSDRWRLRPIRRTGASRAADARRVRGASGHDQDALGRRGPHGNVGLAHRRGTRAGGALCRGCVTQLLLRAGLASGNWSAADRLGRSGVSGRGPGVSRLAIAIRRRPCRAGTFRHTQSATLHRCRRGAERLHRRLCGRVARLVDCDRGLRRMVRG